MQDCVRARAMWAADEALREEHLLRRAHAPQCIDEEALKLLLRGRGGYDTATRVANNLAAFDQRQVALPDSVHSSPYVSVMLPPEDAPFLKDQSLMLRPSKELDEIRHARTVPYIDPKLRSSQRLQAQFARHLLGIGFFRVTRSRRGTVGIFS